MSNLKIALAAKYLSIAKNLVNMNCFNLCPRVEKDSTPIQDDLAQYIFSQLKVEDFQKYCEDRDVKQEYLWIYSKSEDDAKYYIKFKLLTFAEAKQEGRVIPIKYVNDKELGWVKFISFHIQHSDSG